MSNKIMRLRLLVTTLVIILITLVTCHATVQAYHKPVTEDMATETSNSAEEPLSLGELRKKYSETFKFRGPEVKQIALTFDDVPDPRFTPKVLEILRKQGVKATFFVVGSRAQKHPDLLRQIHQNGHLIGNHSYSHPQFKNRSVKQFQNEIQRTEKIIQRTIGYRPKLIRPPYGEINEGQVKWAKLNGYKIINWNVDSLDWKGLGKEKVKANILNAVGPGSIVLQHAGGGVGSNLSGSIDALPDVIQSLRAKGYHFVTLDELLHTKKYK